MCSEVVSNVFSNRLLNQQVAKILQIYKYKYCVQGFLTPQTYSDTLQSACERNFSVCG